MFILGTKTSEELLANEEQRLALVRCIEVIREAGNDVSVVVKAALPTIPWPATYGMRNRLIHNYGNTNYRVVFDMIRDDLPAMASVLAAYLSTHGHPV